MYVGAALISIDKNAWIIIVFVEKKELNHEYNQIERREQRKEYRTNRWQKQ